MQLGQSGICSWYAVYPGERYHSVRAMLTDGSLQNVIRSVFFYLDRSYLLSAKNVNSIWDTGLEVFKKHIASDPALNPKLIKGVLDIYERDRENRGVSDTFSLMQRVMSMIKALCLYGLNFEVQFYERSTKYFSEAADLHSNSLPLAKYIGEVTRQFEQEALLCERYQLEPSSKREITGIIEREMLTEYLDVLTNEKNVGQLLADADMVALSSLYTLLDRIGDPGTSLKPAWERFIFEHGTAIVHDQEREAEMVPRLLVLKDSCDKIWKDCFRSDETLAHARRDTFSKFINQKNPKVKYMNDSKPAERIAKHVDLLLRTGIKALPVSHSTGADADNDTVMKGVGDEDAELTLALDNVLELFRFINGKDVFEAFYKKDLARRLLMQKSASHDAERSMISKLKTGDSIIPVSLFPSSH